ncbi:MAG: efflux RND transporter permease subunit [Ilumatobacter sp.]|uniref:efflux RND transporter permease subunit n=1 Tax=Ilumatobacter sp. TaxID=1967498 RepID=UPI00263A3650|nr:efflux RND transporter permease subunit [Ilumatobacter sp.]MDJ0768980.1 efflux RND transporter permease subunit [Ilumatobacter sp.]
MSAVFDRIAGLVIDRPRAALIGLGIITVALASGMLVLGEQADNTVFLPDDSDVAEAADTLSGSFPDSAGLTNITILHRGDVLTPAGLAQIDAVVAAAVSTPEVAERLALTDPVVSLAAVYERALGVDDLAGVGQQQIDAVTADPRVAPVVANLSGEADGEGLAISSLKLRELGDADALDDAELTVARLVEDVNGPLTVRSLSGATIDDESAESSSSSMSILMVVALVVIAVLLFVFFKSGSDVALTLTGLGVTILGTFGFQGLMGPDGLGIIGLPNSITTMVPIMLIGLVVDYAIQSVAHYREIRAEGATVTEAARRGLRGVLLPLGLASGTTIISFLTNVTSPIPANQDFGIVAAFGVFFGLLTMLTLVPAARAILDQRKEAADELAAPKLMTDAIPGAGNLVERVGGFAAIKPMVVLGVAGVVTVVLGALAAGISTEFDSNDFLPSGGDSLTDLEALEEALGGQTEIVTVLIEAELTDDRTLRNLLTLAESFADELSRPTGAASDITLSLGTLFTDWNTDSGEPGDNYDPGLAEIAAGIDQGITVDPDGVQALLERLEADDPIGFGQVAVNDSNGIDRTLVQFNALTGDQDRTAQMVDDIEGLWYGDRDQLTVTSGEIISLEVTSAMTDSQTGSIVITIVAALIVLMLFFWVTEFKPMLAVIAVFPIVLVLLWVLGTMTLLGIPYNVITALITALSIGIGVDYTIHVIHRFTEELEHGRSLIDATTTTLATTGSALIGSALTTALAFAVLLFSPLTPMQQFGLVTGITILYALIVAIVVVPPMLIVWAAYHRWRAESGHGVIGDVGGEPTAAAAPAGGA